MASINWISPSTYKQLTYWANQKNIPTINSCKFKKLQNPPFQEIKSYNWYDVEVSLNNNLGTTSVLLYSTDDDISLQKNKSKILLSTTLDDPYLVFWKLKPRSNIYLRLQVMEHITFKEGKKYSYYDCPLKMEVFVDE